MCPFQEQLHHLSSLVMRSGLTYNQIQIQFLAYGRMKPFVIEKHLVAAVTSRGFRRSCHGMFLMAHKLYHSSVLLKL